MVEQVQKAVPAEIRAERAVQEGARLCWRRDQEPQPELAEEIKEEPDFVTTPTSSVSSNDSFAFGLAMTDKRRNLCWNCLFLGLFSSAEKERGYPSDHEVKIYNGLNFLDFIILNLKVLPSLPLHL